MILSFAFFRAPVRCHEATGEVVTLLEMNDRKFREHLLKLRLERERKEAQAANAALKKPPAAAKSQKAKKTRSA